MFGSPTPYHPTSEAPRVRAPEPIQPDIIFPKTTEGINSTQFFDKRNDKGNKGGGDYHGRRTRGGVQDPKDIPRPQNPNSKGNTRNRP